MFTCVCMHPGDFWREQKVIRLHWTCMVSPASPASVLLTLWFPARCLPSLYTWINLCCQPTPWLLCWALLEDWECSSLEKFKYREIQIPWGKKDFTLRSSVKKGWWSNYSMPNSRRSAAIERLILSCSWVYRSAHYGCSQQRGAEWATERHQHSSEVASKCVFHGESRSC